MLRIIFISAVFILTFSACSNAKKEQKITETKTEKAQTTDIEPEYKDSELVPLKAERDIVNDRDEAQKLISEFHNNAPKTWDFITTNFYLVDYISDGKGGPKDLIDLGEWYKFETDFTYQHGFFKKIMDEGKYAYDIDKGKLLMLPNKNNQFPSEWKLMHSGEIIVLVGTAKFGNNPFQKHMQNIEKQPEIKQ